MHHQPTVLVYCLLDSWDYDLWKNKDIKIYPKPTKISNYNKTVYERYLANLAEDYCFAFMEKNREQLDHILYSIVNMMSLNVNKFYKNKDKYCSSPLQGFKFRYKNNLGTWVKAQVKLPHLVIEIC